MKASPLFGSVSRPSISAWIATRGTRSRSASSTRAKRCWSIACTPPVPSRPIRCSVPPRAAACRQAATKASLAKKLPSAIAAEIRTRSCITTRPAPRLRWPTSLLPICPSGSPTRSPDASSRVRGARSQSLSHVGVCARATALPSRSARYPHPSRTTSTTGAEEGLGIAGVMGTARPDGPPRSAQCTRAPERGPTARRARAARVARCGSRCIARHQARQRDRLTRVSSLAG